MAGNQPLKRSVAMEEDKRRALMAMVQACGIVPVAQAATTGGGGKSSAPAEDTILHHFFCL